MDYPVVWTPEKPEHYLRRDFYGTHASGGTPFLDGRNQAQAEGQNLIVYGHNMLDGSMFKPVLQYLTPNFRQTHQDIYLELNGAQYHYQVIAALEWMWGSALGSGGGPVSPNSRRKSQNERCWFGAMAPKRGEGEGSFLPLPGFVPLPPDLHGVQDGLEALTQVCQAVLHSGRHLGKDLPVN